MSIRSRFYRAKHRAKHQFDLLFGVMNRQVAWAASQLVLRWREDSAHWIDGERRARDRDEISGGIFDASIFDSREWREYVFVRKALTAEGLCAWYRCQRCGSSVKLEVNWLELSAIAVDAAPELMPAHLRAGWSLGEPSEWRRNSDGGWRPCGVGCNRCGAGSDTYKAHDAYGRFYTYAASVSDLSLPAVYPAEVRALIFSALNDRKMPPSFFAAVALYAWLKVASVARARLDEVLGKAPAREPEPEPEPSGPEPIARKPAPPPRRRVHIRLEAEPFVNQYTAKTRVNVVALILDAQRFDTIWAHVGCLAPLLAAHGHPVRHVQEALKSALASSRPYEVSKALGVGRDVAGRARDALEQLVDTANAYPDARINVNVREDGDGPWVECKWRDLSSDDGEQGNG